MTAAILVEASGDNRIVIVPGALAALTPAARGRLRAADRGRRRPARPAGDPGRDRAARARGRPRRGRAHGAEPGARRRPEPIAPVADYLVPNETEARAVRALGRRRSSSRSGEQGARIGDDVVPAFPARAVDTTGAGRRVLRRLRRRARRGRLRPRGRPLGLRRRRAHGRARRRHSRACPSAARELEERLSSRLRSRMTRLIVDTDTAGDDVFSLLIALLAPARAAGGDHRLLRERPLRAGGRERALHGRDGRPRRARCRSTRAARSR